MAGPELMDLGWQPQGAPLDDSPMFAGHAPLPFASAPMDSAQQPAVDLSRLGMAPTAQQPIQLAPVAEQPVFDLSRVGTLEQPAQLPQQAGRTASRQDASQRQVHGASSGGGVRSILGKEIKTRTAEALAAQDSVGRALETYDKANQGLVETQQKGIEAEARGAQAQADAIAAMRRQAADAQMLDEGERLLEQDAIAARQTQIQQAHDKLSRETVGDRRTRSERTMATLAVALASIGDGLMQLGGQKGDSTQRVVGQIQGQIDRDVEEQIRQINSKRDALTAQERAFKDFLAEVGDARAQRQYLAAQKWQELGLISDEIAASTQSEVKRNSATELSKLAAQQSESAKLQGAQHVAEDTSNRVRQIRDLGLELQLRQATQPAAKQKERPAGYGLRKISPEGTGNDGDATKAQEIASKVKPILAGLRNLSTMAKQGATLSPTQRQTAARRLSSLTSQYNGVFGDGTAPNEAQLESMKDIFLNPTEINLQNVDKFYDTFIQDGEQLANEQMSPYGYVLDEVDAQPYRGK